MSRIRTLLLLCLVLLSGGLELAGRFANPEPRARQVAHRRLRGRRRRMRLGSSSFGWRKAKGGEESSVQM